MDSSNSARESIGKLESKFPDPSLELIPLLRTIKGLGNEFTASCEYLCEDLQTQMGYEDSLRENFADVSSGDLLRIVRNSTHGYLFDNKRKRRMILSSSGDMSVFMGGAPILLWNAFISDTRTFLSVNERINRLDRIYRAASLAEISLRAFERVR